MSYDIWAYPPDSPIPSKPQARAFLRSLEVAPDYLPAPWTEEEISRRDMIAAVLQKHNPRLQRAVFNFEAIARRRNIPEEVVRLRMQYAQLNPPREDLAIQLSVWRDHAFISIPFWYRGEEKELVFDQLLGYLRVIRNAAGYSAYDGQAEIAFDPIAAATLPSGMYGSNLDMFHKAIAKHAQKSWPQH